MKHVTIPSGISSGMTKLNFFPMIRCYGTPMLNSRKKRRAADGARAIDRIKDIEKSIVNLGDEDLLDLADIFSGELRTPLGETAFAELERRGLSLKSSI